MLNRVPVKVIQKALEIVFVFADVFPKATLTDTALAMLDAGGRRFSVRAPRLQVKAREGFFDLSPAERIVGIVCGQRPHGMQVSGQQDDGEEAEGPLLSDLRNRLVQT